MHDCAALLRSPDEDDQGFVPQDLVGIRALRYAVARVFISISIDQPRARQGRRPVL